MNQNQYARVSFQQQSMYFLLISHPSNLSITRFKKCSKYFVGSKNDVSISDTFYAFNQSRPLNPVNPGAHVLEIALSTLPSLLLFNPKGKIHRKLSHLLKRSTNPKDLCNRSCFRIISFLWEEELFFP